MSALFPPLLQKREIRSTQHLQQARERTLYTAPAAAIDSTKQSEHESAFSCEVSDSSDAAS